MSLHGGLDVDDPLLLTRREAARDRAEQGPARPVDPAHAAAVAADDPYHPRNYRTCVEHGITVRLEPCPVCGKIPPATVIR